MHAQFHAKGSTLTGDGAQIGDFLFKEYGQALAIVEIKTPEAALLQGTAYRGQDVYGPNSELSGAVADNNVASWAGQSLVSVPAAVAGSSGSASHCLPWSRNFVHCEMADVKRAERQAIG
ncbi:MAG: hypothetical protein ACTHNO_04255 [Ralstonia sp.]|uniref:hypothetical protein n=1 Tax=Ralstonia sp. TaxID=54061 RepID=UPI003F80445B